MTEIDWAADDNVGLAYRKRKPTKGDYLQAAHQMLEIALSMGTKHEFRGCVCCGDAHSYQECHHNILLLARERVAERGKWQCFHCGFETGDAAEAEEHFGKSENEVAKCLGEKAEEIKEKAWKYDDLCE